MSRSSRWVPVVVAAVVASTAVVASGHAPKKITKKLKPVVTTFQYSNVDPPPNPDPRTPPAADPTDSFSGQVSKVRGSGVCPIDGRTVRVYLAVPNSFPGDSIEEATTAADGSWQLPAEDVVAGTYRARATKELFTVTIPPIPQIGEEGHKHKFLCYGKLSDPIVAGP